MNKLALGCMSALLLTAPVYAQSNVAPAPGLSGVQNAQALSNQQINNLWRASKLDGVNIYNNGNEKIGEIDDVLIDHSGKSIAVVVDVGGFLGIGTHRVALKFEDVKFNDMPRNASASNPSNANDRAASTTTGGTTRPSTGTNVSADSDRSSSSAQANASNRMYPDHATLNMTKDQLKALPQVSYRR